jgi:pyruvate kinase
MGRKTKIVCTIGPSSSTEEVLSKMILGGMNVARLNFSHGTHEAHLEVLQILRKVSKDLRTPIAILQDLCGPKIRVGKIENGGFEIASGETLVIHREIMEGKKEGAFGHISCTYENLITDVKEGCTILMDDGYLSAEVVRIHNGEIHCKVIHGGLLKSNKGINLPNVSISSPSFTKKDKKDLEWGIANQLDFVAISFVRSAQDVAEVQEFIRSRGSDIHVIAKLEKPEAVKDKTLDEIIQISDGILIARGDLGVEMDVEQVPFQQKKIIELCRTHSKVVITATQMLESMIHNPRPTRAEVSDIVQAIDDGTDALMLSGETANGEYPTQAVTMMSKIAHHAERFYELNETHYGREERRNEMVVSSFKSILSLGMSHMVRNSEIKMIVCFTMTGSTAVLVSKQHPSTVILGATPSQKNHPTPLPLSRRDSCHCSR